MELNKAQTTHPRTALLISKHLNSEIYLRQATFLGTHAHFARVCIEHASVLLAMLLVLCPDVTFSQAPVHSHFQCFFQVPGIHRDNALRPHANRNVIKHALRQLFLKQSFQLLLKLKVTNICQIGQYYLKTKL